MNRQESLASTTRVATYGQVHEAYLRQSGEKEKGRTKRRDEEACSFFLHAHAPPLNYPDKSVQAKGILPASLYLRVEVPTACRMVRPACQTGFRR
ncbi:MAG: hypothetical protein R6U66_08385 [Bacteroidales bacterium]